MSALRRSYGQGPLHLAAHLVALAAVGLAAAQLLRARAPVNAIAWLLGAAVAHDLVLAPSYIVLDRLALAVGGRRRRRVRLDPINHVRVVAVVAGALLLVYFPLILTVAPRNFVRVAGHARDVSAAYLEVVAAVAVLSAVGYALRVGLATRRRGVEELERPVGTPPDEDPPGG